ncbi:MAG TPA: hypothetical protein VNU70_10905 [Puia sp.]|jgi:hypothetical protein|nr:hypothetical protein [Puia sp.]
MIKGILGRAFRKMLAGDDSIREFATIGIGDAVAERVYLQADGLFLEVTKNQWMEGLEPLTFAIWIESPELRDALAQAKEYTIYFRKDAPDDPREPGRKALAVAQLNYFNRIDDERGTLFLLQIRSSHIHHIHPLKARLLYWKYYKKPDVSFEKTKAIVTAYSYPRRVRVISFQQGKDYNYIFPMDLLGDVRTSERYLLGMRHSNTVLKKIMDVGKIVVAEFPAPYKPEIYKLGRNHSASPPSLDQLPFGVFPTRRFGFYLPEWVESYKEISIRQTLDIGSHMLLFGEWSEDVVLKPATPRLHHIHFLHFLNQKGRGETYPLV